MGRIEERVAERLREILVAGGVSENRAGLEVLFMLPDEFVRQYQEVYLAALPGVRGGSVMGPQAGDEGRIKKKAKRGGGGGSGGDRALRGKRYVREADPLGDEEATALKARVDRRLRRVVQEAREENGVVKSVGVDQARVDQAGVGPGKLPRRALVHVGQGESLRKCIGCGKFASGDWVICPRPHD